MTAGIGSVRIDVAPVDALVDEVRRIVLHGFTPGTAVTLQAQLAHPDGSRWRSEAVFLADAEGGVDVARHAPQSGDWSSADATAPVWAMRRERAPDKPALSERIDALHVLLSARDATGQTADAPLVLRFAAPGVVRHELRENGLSGTLFSPGGKGPHPAILVLAGSGGGIPEQRAALYAAHGYAALALGYFKAPGRPDHISDTPLEYFETALHWMRTHLAPRHDFIAVSGVSRGGELTLLLGATFPEQISAVIAYVPSAHVNGTLRAGRPDQTRDATAWTWRGEPLPNAWRNNPHADWTAFDAPRAPGEPIRQAAAFDSVERDPAAMAAARIPVERITAPVLLISGTDDGFWPSARYGQQVADTLHARGHRWPVEHVVGEGAGHAIGLPQLPATLIAKPHPVAGLVLDGGGTAAANARASARSWSSVLAFLDNAVANARSS